MFGAFWFSHTAVYLKEVKVNEKRPLTDMYEIGGMNFLVSMNCVTKASSAVTPTVTRSRIDFEPNQNVEKHTDTIRAVGM